MPGGAPQILGGPVWFFLTVLILGTVALALFVFFDSFRPKRAEQAASLREPLWTYTAGQGVFLAALLVAQVARGYSWVSAVPAVLMLLALAQGIAYLLRVVFPKAGPALAQGESPYEHPDADATVRGESSAP